MVCVSPVTNVEVERDKGAQLRLLQPGQDLVQASEAYRELLYKYWQLGPEQETGTIQLYFVKLTMS